MSNYKLFKKIFFLFKISYISVCSKTFLNLLIYIYGHICTYMDIHTYIFSHHVSRLKWQNQWCSNKRKSIMCKACVNSFLSNRHIT